MQVGQESEQGVLRVPGQETCCCPPPHNRCRPRWPRKAHAQTGCVWEGATPAITKASGKTPLRRIPRLLSLLADRTHILSPVFAAGSRPGQTAFPRNHPRTKVRSSSSILPKNLGDDISPTEVPSTAPFGLRDVSSEVPWPATLPHSQCSWSSF